MSYVSLLGELNYCYAGVAIQECYVMYVVMHDVMYDVMHDVIRYLMSELL